MTDKKARMGDVAALSGLSRSTVDRVLNGRNGVRQETVRRVEEAMRTLGYAPSSLSARKIVENQSIALILPEGTNPFFEVIHDKTIAMTQRDRFVGSTFEVFRYDAYAPNTLNEALSLVPAQVDAVVLVGVDNDDATQAINELTQSGKRVVTIVSDTPRAQRYAYVGQDNFAAGRTAANLLAAMIPPGEGEVALLLGHLQFRHLLDRMSGFRQALGLARPELTVVQPRAYGSDPETAKRVIAELANKGDVLRGAYLAGGGQPNLIASLSSSRTSPLKIIGHEVTDATRRALGEGRFQAVLAHNMDEVALRAIEIAQGQRSPDEGICPVKIYVQGNLPA